MSTNTYGKNDRAQLVVNGSVLDNDSSSHSPQINSANRNNDSPSDTILIPPDRKTKETKYIDEKTDSKGNWFLRVGSAAFYGIASLMIMVINKRILTVYAFPSFQVLGLGQMISTIVILWIGRGLNIINFPDFSPSIITKISPLPLFYAGNMIFGLAGTQALSLPMMIVLRRFTVLMTMVAEYVMLKVKPDFNVQLSVLMMIFGAFVAAINDLAFSFLGYTYILMNNVCSCMNVVVTKKKLNAKDLGKYGLLFYNSLLMLPFTIMLCYITGDIYKAYEFNGWTKTNNHDGNIGLTDYNATKVKLHHGGEDIQFELTNLNVVFLFHFLLSCVFGFILMFATLLCTLHNSALTTMIIGSLKNIIITYVGMFIGGDYIFSWWNFIGITISAIAALSYARITFGRKKNSNN